MKSRKRIGEKKLWVKRAGGDGDTRG